MASAFTASSASVNFCPTSDGMTGLAGEGAEAAGVLAAFPAPFPAAGSSHPLPSTTTAPTTTATANPRW
ncbi:hypothetical protein [Streptomyces vinaceus]|uniref:hypothetical protein n=1 Tax=Streptomyces vinaceus TaxID=1960 RepID=UPI0037F6C926